MRRLAARWADREAAAGTRRRVVANPKRALRSLAGLTLLVAGLHLVSASAGAELCSVDEPCTVDAGAYLASPPPSWDGVRPLPVLLFFHGYGGSARQVLRNSTLLSTVHEAMEGAGALLVAPDGLENTWAHVGSPSSARDEIAFVDAVMADVRARWPVDERRLLVSGFSQGGSMVWDVACYRGEAFSAFLPIAGGFWRPHPERCDAPVNLRHIHGLGDTVVPMAGRPIAQDWLQGDVLEGMTLWRETNDCPTAPDHTRQNGRLTCETWSRCETGRTLEVCLHDGGHDFTAAWIAEGLDWAEGLAIEGR